MEGIIFVAGLLAAVTVIGIRSRKPLETPGLGLTVALVAASAWYLFA